MSNLPRIIAIDWSGDASSSAKKSWLAEVVGGEVVRLEAGRDRQAMARHLVELSILDQHVIVGLDFAFSFPCWYIAQLAVADAPSFWHVVAEQGETWLRECAPPFWGRPGKTRPELQAHLRRTELEVGQVNGIPPKSTFQIGGGGAAGRSRELPGTLPRSAVTRTPRRRILRGRGRRPGVRHRDVGASRAPAAARIVLERGRWRRSARGRDLDATAATGGAGPRPASLQPTRSITTRHCAPFAASISRSRQKRGVNS